MRKLFLDTNIFLRFFLKDNKKQYENITEIFSFVEKGECKPYTSSIVLLEINYVLRNIYKLTVDQCIQYLGSIRKIRGITIIDKTDSEKALFLYSMHKIKFGDCFVASQLPQNTILVTYDKEFKKVERIRTKKPEEIKIS